MPKHFRTYAVFVLGLALSFAAGPAKAQLGNSGSIEGVVKDPSGGWWRVRRLKFRIP
jgi:hypothetical protein